MAISNIVPSHLHRTAPVSQPGEDFAAQVLRNNAHYFLNLPSQYKSDSGMFRLADLARTTRLNKGLALALKGHVEVLPSGNARVASDEDPAIVYEIGVSGCGCDDAPHAEDGLCAHRWAIAIMQARFPMAAVWEQEVCHVA